MILQGGLGGFVDRWSVGGLVEEVPRLAFAVRQFSCLRKRMFWVWDRRTMNQGQMAVGGSEPAAG